jgi:phosphoribosylaminoimidazolecarboxamide formyltransferase/IMP cyclohydrolase
VSDKTGLVEFARALADLGVELISTGGTAAALRDAGLDVTSVETFTGFPEMMDGRVKTLHPAIHGGILALRDHEEHQRAMRQHGIRPIDLVCINLYPFEETIAKPGAPREEAIEQIDVGGPAMIRAAAKNHEWVAAVTAPAQYADVIESLRDHGGETTLALRARLAADAFVRTAAYDAAIADHLSAPVAEEHPSAFPRVLRLALRKLADLRYGENPHQRAALYFDPAFRGPSVVAAEQLHGKELSYNNLNDAAAALSLALELAALEPGVSGAAIIKHANPCGAALAPAARHAVELALKGDPVAAYGGVLAVSSTIDEAVANLVAQPGKFFEVVIAPAFTPAALDLLRARSANLRLLAYDALRPPPRDALSFKSLPGGVLVQTADTRPATPSEWQRHAGPPISPERFRAAAALWTIAKHLSSNAIAIGGHDCVGVRLLGAGAGQMDRVTACRLAVEKAGPLARGGIAVSDAFFPFPDGPDLLIRAGVTTIVHPGGSKRDQDTFDLCERHAVTCLTTGVRHFRH